MRSSPFRRRRPRAPIVLLLYLLTILKRMWFVARRQVGKQLHNARSLSSSTSMFVPARDGVTPRARGKLKSAAQVENPQWLRPALDPPGSPERCEGSTRELDPCRFPWLRTHTRALIVLCFCRLTLASALTWATVHIGDF